jgi:hypothetical protein
VAFEGKDVLEGPEYRLDALAKRSEMWPFFWFVPACGPDVYGVPIPDCRSELLARISLVGKQGLPAPSPAAPEQFQPHLPLIALGRGEGKRPGSAVTGEDGVQSDSPEVAGVTGAVSVVRKIAEGGAKHGLPATGALHRGRVDKQKIVGETRTLLGKDEKKPAKDRRQTASALEVTRLPGQIREEMGKAPSGRPKKPAVGRDAHDGLGHTEGDDLSIGDSAAGISRRLWQKIVSCAINDGAEGVEVGVHRGLQADGVAITVALGPSASNPFFRAMFVESII